VEWLHIKSDSLKLAGIVVQALDGENMLWEGVGGLRQNNLLEMKP